MQMYTNKLAEKVVSLGYGSLSDEVLGRAKEAILDTIGVALAASRSDSANILMEYINEIGGREEATIIGMGKRSSALNAALANGNMGHVLDYDDVSWSIIGHPAVVTVFPALALAEKFGVSGKEVLVAFVAGYETVASIGRGLIPDFCEKGWHSTGTLGIFGATGTAGKMYGLSIEEMSRALGIAGSLAAGVKINIGTMTKHLHAGRAAFNGITAAFLANKGYSASDKILEGKDGFCYVYAPRYDLEKMVESFGNPFDLVSNGALFKKWPSCFESHPCIEAMLGLAKENDILPEQVESIEIGATPLVVDVLFYDRPRTSVEAKFSAHFCAAVSLIKRSASLDEFDNEVVNNPNIRDLMKRVKLSADPELSVKGYTLSQEEGISKTRATIIMKNGKRFFKEVPIAKGEPQRRLSTDEVIEKFKTCTRDVLKDEDIEKSIDLVMNLEKADSVFPLMDILRG
ncbi:MAG TPA: MmgE/PrpD family protein [Desulfatiglandales bacterium]|nr:MmgE/PrpD family protein [Desulfatiglandales bacterium]